MHHVFHDYLHLDCNFDTNFCGWYFDPSSDFAWKRQSNGTNSTSTGPTSDHTTGSKINLNLVENFNKKCKLQLEVL